MSYILNALRKSEQERNAEKTDPASITLRETWERPRYYKIIWIGAVFLAINCLVLGYLLYRLQQPARAVAIQKTAETPPVIKTADALPAQSKPVTADAQEPIAPQAISDLIAAKSRTVPAPASAATKAPDSPPQRHMTTASKPIETERGAPKEAPPVTPVIAAKKPLADKPAAVIQNPLPIRPRPAENPAPSVAVSHAPWLREMDSQFREEVPAFTVNALAFVDAPSERFVIIDMTKYKAGQRVKDAIELKEILPDSLVLRYQDRDFRVEGP